MNPNRNTASLVKQTFLLVESLIPGFAACFLSEEITDKLISLDFYNETDWYTFKPQTQRVLPFIIMHTQNPLVMELYGNNAVNCETSKKVIFIKILIN